MFLQGFGEQLFLQICPNNIFYIILLVQLDLVEVDFDKLFLDHLVLDELSNSR